MRPAARFLVQIVDEGGVVARFPAGGAIELDLCAALTAALVAREVAGVIGSAASQRRLVELAKQAILGLGVGFFRREAHVAQDIETGLRTALREVEADLVAEATPVVADVVAEVLHALKRQTVAIA